MFADRFVLPLNLICDKLCTLLLCFNPTPSKQYTVPCFLDAENKRFENSRGRGGKKKNAGKAANNQASPPTHTHTVFYRIISAFE